MTGSEARLASLLEAIAHVCQADGVTLSELHSIHFLDEEISIQIRRGDGSCRINTYPVAALRGVIRTAGAPATAPPETASRRL